MYIESVMPSNHLILCCPLLLLTSIFPSIRVFSNESAFLIRWPKYWNFSISPSNEYSGLISFRIDWFDFLAVKGFSRVFSNSQSGQLLSHVWLCNPMDYRMPGFPVPPTPGACSNSCPSSWWCHLTILSSVIPFFSCLQSFPVSGSFPMSRFFASHGQSIGISVLAPVLPMNTQDWSPLEWTGWISLQSKGLSRVFSNTTVQKHQFFGTQPSSQSNSHIHTWPLEKP